MSTVTVVQGTAVTIGVGGASATASCPANQRIIGGGFVGSSTGVTVSAARITTSGLGGTFTVSGDDGPLLGQTIAAVAYCVL